MVTDFSVIAGASLPSDSSVLVSTLDSGKSDPLPRPKNERRERSGLSASFTPLRIISAAISSSVFFALPPPAYGWGSGMKAPPSAMSGTEKSIAPPFAYLRGAACIECRAVIGASSKSRRRVAVVVLYGLRRSRSIALISIWRNCGSGYCASKSICARRLTSSGLRGRGASIVGGPRRLASSSSCPSFVPVAPSAAYTGIVLRSPANSVRMSAGCNPAVNSSIGLLGIRISSVWSVFVVHVVRVRGDRVDLQERHIFQQS